MLTLVFYYFIIRIGHIDKLNYKRFVIFPTFPKLISKPTIHGLAGSPSVKSRNIILRDVFCIAGVFCNTFQFVFRRRIRHQFGILIFFYKGVHDGAKSQILGVVGIVERLQDVLPVLLLNNFFCISRRTKTLKVNRINNFTSVSLYNIRNITSL